MNKLCPECGKEINENFNVCPNCGYQTNNNQNGNKKKKGLPAWAIVLIVIACLLPIIILVLALAGTFGILNFKINTNSSSYPIILEGRSGFSEITYNEYEEKMYNNEHFVMVIVNDGCGYCEAYEPVVEEVANEYGLPIYYINLAHLTNWEWQSLSNSNSYLRKNQWGTPTTLYMYGDTVIDAIGGYVDEYELEDFLDDYFVMD